MTHRKGAERAAPARHENLEAALQPEFKLRVCDNGTIRIRLQRHSLTVRREDLMRYGWNSIADACRLIDKKIKEQYT